MEKQTILEKKLEQISPMLGIDLNQKSTLAFPPESSPILNIDSVQTPGQGVVGYDPTMEAETWAAYTRLQTQKDVASLKMSPLDSICECNDNKNDIAALNAQCGLLTEYNCKRIGCCVFTSQNKCVAGNSSGPSAEYSSNIDYYYYKNKCYGSKCPEDKKC